MLNAGIQDKPSADHGRYNHKEMLCVIFDCPVDMFWYHLGFEVCVHFSLSTTHLFYPCSHL
jgi:hypothetical protein